MTSQPEQPGCVIHSEADLLSVRSLLRAEAARADLGVVQMTRFITAGSELARNILKYARGSGGAAVATTLFEHDRRGVMACFTDRGPGIPDLELAMTDGYSTGGSLGIGLPGAKRLVDELTVATSPDDGTSVVIVMWRR